MKKLYLVCYFNEREDGNDADVIIMDDDESQRDAFKTFFKKTYDYDIKNEHIINMHLVTEVFDKKGGKYYVNFVKD